MTDDERSNQKTPLCQTPTSQLLQLAAQFLPPTPCTSGPDGTDQPVDASDAQSAIDILKQGWWTASPSQLHEISNSIKNAGLVEHMAELKLTENFSDLVLPQAGTDRARGADSVTVEQTVSENNKPQNDAQSTNNLDEKSKVDDGIEQKSQNNVKEASNKGVSSANLGTTNRPISLLKKGETVVVGESGTSPYVNNTARKGSAAVSSGPAPPVEAKPLQPGSYWYAKQFQKKNLAMQLPQPSSHVVSQVITSSVHPSAELAMHCCNTNTDSGNARDEEPLTPHASLDTVESCSADTLSDIMELQITKKDQLPEPPASERSESEIIEAVKSTGAVDMEHKLGNCVAEDCMCYEAVFRQDHPIETSSVKSESSFTGSPDGSPVKVLKQQRLSSSSISDDSINNSLNKRRSRIAAKFGHSLE